MKDIENISLEQLEAVSMDMNIPVPEGFEERLKKDIRTLDRLTTDDAGYGLRARTVRIISVAAVATLLVGTGIAIRQNEPKDTFDDPYMAYAELEKAFAAMSGGMQKALAMAEESEAAFDKVTSIFE